jgi:hypothetical protein
MTSHRRSVVLAALMGLVALGCDRKSDAPPPPTPTVEPPTTQVPPVGSPVAAPTNSAAAQVDIPTEEDFEEEAEREITADNLEAELDKLEREIGQ